MESGQPPQARGTTFTDDQIFFRSYAQSWCGKWTPQYLEEYLKTDPHAPPEYRANGPLSNMPEFAGTFQCGPGSKMVRPVRCEIW
ncbi:MAG TPA: M13-type metalloendopeptidase [Polyangia bacterium]